MHRTPLRQIAVLLATTLLLSPAAVRAHDGLAFRQEAREAVRAAFATPREDRVTLHPVRDTAFLLYGPSPDARMPFTQIRCARSTTFSISLRGDTQSGITSLGLLRIGVCASDTELPAALVASQGPMSRLMMTELLRQEPRVAELGVRPHASRAVGSGLTLQTFTVLALGHGAAISPTALLTGAPGKAVVALQFELPPRCDQVANPDLLACQDLDRFMEQLALRARETLANSATGPDVDRTPQSAR